MSNGNLTAFQHLGQASRAMARIVADVLFPPVCLGCRAPVGREGGLCPACWRSLRFIERPFCEVLGAPFAHDFGAGIVSADAIANPPPFSRCRSAVVYSGVARRLAQALKYRDATDLAPWLAAWMVRAGTELIDDADLIAPLPLHRWRFFERRFNQSAELARAVARQTGVGFDPSVLTRKKPTRRQVGLTRAERKENVRAAFAVPADRRIAIAGRRVLIVDDVFTTGATVNSAALALLKAGASAVDVLTFARVTPGAYEFSDDDIYAA